MTPEFHAFHILCCGLRRGLINGALVCSRCDFNHLAGSVIPNEHDARDVYPLDATHWMPEMSSGEEMGGGRTA